MRKTFASWVVLMSISQLGHTSPFLFGFDDSQNFPANRLLSVQNSSSLNLTPGAGISSNSTSTSSTSLGMPNWPNSQLTPGYPSVRGASSNEGIVNPSGYSGSRGVKGIQGIQTFPDQDYYRPRRFHNLRDRWPQK